MENIFVCAELLPILFIFYMTYLQTKMLTCTYMYLHVITRDHMRSDAITRNYIYKTSADSTTNYFFALFSDAGDYKKKTRD